MSINTVKIALSYRQEWQDGFGARGWKLDCSIDDPYVIAATAECGSRIPTSVLVHDILDHYLCGLPLSGHRNEAIALVQLGFRTGSDPFPDFAGMVDEDLMHGRVNGESLRHFLPTDLLQTLPPDETEGKAIINYLTRKFGKRQLRTRLINRFVELGEEGAQEARRHWQAFGLDYQLRSRMGLALQQILIQADKALYEKDIEVAHGQFLLTDQSCSLKMTVPENRLYQQAV